MGEFEKFKLPDAHVELKLDGQEKIRKLQTELEAAADEIDRVNSKLQDTEDLLERSRNSLKSYKDSSGISVMEKEIEKYRETARQAVAEFSNFLQSANIYDGWDDSRFSDLFESINEGSMTALQAITAVKTQFDYLLKENYEKNGGLFDSPMVQNFTTALDRLGATVDLVAAKLETIQTEGVKALGSVTDGNMGAGSGEVASILGQVEAATHNLSEEAKDSYSSITNLVQSLNDYSNIDNTKLLAVSQAFKNIGDVGKGKFSTKTIENIVYLTKQLQAVGGESRIRFDFTGLNELKVSKSSLNNLATYLPQIAAIDSTKLETLSNVDLSNFNNIKVSKASAENIALLMQAVDALREYKAATISVQDSSIGVEIDGSLNELNDAIKEEIGLQKQVDELAGDTQELQITQAETEAIVSKNNALEQTVTLTDAVNKSSIVSEDISHLNSQLANEIKPVNLEITADMKDVEAVKEQVVQIAAEMTKIQGFDTGKVAVISNPITGDFKSATIQYIKDGIAQTVTDTIRWVDETKNVKAHYEYTRRAVEDVSKATRQQIKEAKQAAINQETLFKRANHYVTTRETSAFDANKSNNILGVSNIDEIRAKLNEIIALRDKLDTQKGGSLLNSDELFTETQNLNRMIESLEGYIKAAQNAETYSQTFKPIDITGGAIKAMLGIESLARDIRDAGVNSEYLQSEISKLYTAIQTVDSSGGLENITQQTKILRQEFANERKDAVAAAKDQKALYNDLLPIYKERQRIEVQLDSDKSLSDTFRNELESQEVFLKAEEDRIRAKARIILSEENETKLLLEKGKIIRKNAQEEALYAGKQETRETNSLIGGIDSGYTNLQKITNQLQKAGLQSTNFERSVELLRAQLANVTDAAGLAAVNDQIQNLQLNANAATDELAKQEQLFKALLPLEKERITLQNQLNNPKATTDEKASINALMQNVQLRKDEAVAAAGLNLTEEQRIELEKKVTTEVLKQDVAVSRRSDKQRAANAKEYQDQQKLLAQLKAMKAAFPKMEKDQGFSSRWNALADGLEKGSISAKDASAQMTILRREMTAAGLQGETLGNRLAAAFKKFSQYLTVSSILLSGIRSIKQMVTNVIGLDKSLVEFNKVADLTDDKLLKITEQAFDMGEAIGRTGKDVIDAATEFKRAGYEIATSMKMAKAALVMTNVGDGIESTTDAASKLLAVIKGFEMPEDDVMSVVDLINQISNTSPIGFNDIAEGLKRVSGTLHLTGASLAETAGLLTGGFSQLRDIEKVSSGLVMISQRLRGVDENGDSVDGLAAKVRDEFAAVGVAVEDANGELRSTFDILKDYAAVYKTLGSKQIQYLGEKSSGNRQVTVLNAIMQQWGEVEHAVEQANQSVNSAEKENAIFVESIQGRIQQLQSSWEKFSATVIDSGLIKFFVDLGNAALKGLDWGVSGIGTLPTLLAGLGTGALIKNLGLTHNDGLLIGLTICEDAA